MEQAGASAAVGIEVVTIVTLIACSLVDLRSRRIPDAFTLPASAAVVLLAAIGGPSGTTDLRGAFVGALCFGGPLAAISLARPASLGMGDAKLAALIGAAVGSLDLSLLPATALGGLLLGAVLGAATWIRRRDAAATIAFGPPLAAAAIVALLVA